MENTTGSFGIKMLLTLIWHHVSSGIGTLYMHKKVVARSIWSSTTISDTTLLFLWEIISFMHFFMFSASMIFLQTAKNKNKKKLKIVS